MPIGCRGEIALICPAGYEDGCIGGRTIDRACVSVGAHGGPTCEAEIALVCGDGERDACNEPAKSTHHICITK